MKTKLVHGPWLQNDDDPEDPSWNKGKEVWCWIKPPSAVGGFFEIGEETTEIRFCLSNEPEHDSYEYKLRKDDQGLILKREGKTFQWKHIGDGLFGFLQGRPKLTHLSLEVR